MSREVNRYLMRMMADRKFPYEMKVTLLHTLYEHKIINVKQRSAARRFLRLCHGKPLGPWLLTR